MAEFKINRLRFTWSGAWQANTVYGRDSVAQYNGKTYACLLPHTSNANFYNDLNFVDGLGASTPYWSLIVDGKTWRNLWTTATFYSLGNIVLFGGVAYICINPHTSTAFASNSANWLQYSQFARWDAANSKTNWTINTVYGVGDVVKYGGIVYNCVTNHTSSSTESLGADPEVASGLEADQAKWTVLSSGINYLPTGWQNGTRYKLNDIVKYGANLWKANAGHTSASTFNPSRWTMWLPGEMYNPTTWSSSTVYQIGDVVNYGGYQYINNTTNNSNNTPSTDATNWTLFTQNYSFKGEWAAGAYKIGETVRRKGRLYTALSDIASGDPSAGNIVKTYTAAASSGITVKVNTTSLIKVGMIVIGTGFTLGQSVVSISDSTTVILDKGPDGVPADNQTLSFVGVNTGWSLVNTGNAYIGRWVTFPSSYSIGDLVVWQNATYMCIQTHNNTAAENTQRPDLDVARTYWALFINHDKNNSLTELGDIEAFSAGQPTTIPVGTESYSLRATKNTGTNLTSPTWSHLHGITNVFYVAPTGTDSTTSGWGETWDKPFRTIAFACNYANNGNQNPNAKAILTSAKSWMVTEMYYWMLNQKSTSTSPFTPDSVFDATKTFRDAQFVVDAIIYDISRGGNSQTVATALAYFSQENANTFINLTTAAQIPYFIAALNQLASLAIHALDGTTPATNYQSLLGTTSFTGSISGTTLTVTTAPTRAGILIGQVISGGSIPAGTYVVTKLSGTGTSSSSTWTVSNSVTQSSTTITSVPVIKPTNAVIAEFSASATVTGLFGIITTALTAQTSSVLPSPNSGVTVSIMVKTGTYNETLPITIGENIALVGDELRGSVVQPAVRIVQTVKAASDTENTLTISDTSKLTNGMPIQLVSAFAGLTAGTTYYVIGSTITATAFSISATAGGTTPVALTLVTVGAVTMYAGDCLKDMFRLRNGSGLRNFTLNGLLGIVGPINEYLTQRVTGGSYSSLDPGNGPTDTSAWIFKRSPYVQNVTTFGEGCVGLKIDGTLHNGGNKSIVCNDYTQVISNGIGILVTGPNSVCEAVSVFSYFCHVGYFADNGGRLRATNGNNSYGTYGCIAEGFDSTEVPITGNVFNQSTQVQATVQSSFGSAAQLIRTSFANAGSGYTTTTTNLINYSNDFLGASWSPNNVTLSKNITAPTGYIEGWTLASTGSTSTMTQTTAVPASGALYTALSGVGGSGSAATFDITVTGTVYLVTTNFGGSGYIVGDQIVISGNQLGGINIVNDCTLTVFSLSGNAILTATPSGTVPTGSAKGYTTSIYVKQGSAPTISLASYWSGSAQVYNGVTFNFASATITPFTGGSGQILPTQYGALSLPNGWYRLWYSSYDSTGLNTAHTSYIYPVGLAGLSGQFSYVYASQLENSTTSGEPSFYLEIAETTPYTAYANFNIVGSGTGALAIGDEIRSNSIFETRVITDSIGTTGGAGYLTASNNAQAGTRQQIQLAQSDTNTAQNYIGMRLFINSGTGAGQYGYISYYSDSTKIASIVRESFDPLQVTSSITSENSLVLGASYDTNTLYAGQPVQFIPTYYNTTVSSVGITSVNVTASVGGQVNTLTVTSTAQLQLNMAIKFSGTVFSNISAGFTYYINAIVNSTTIRISSELFGPDWPLTTVAAIDASAMVMNYPSYTNYLQGATANMVINYPIDFTGTTAGGLVIGTTYYINDIVNGNNFTISGSLVTVAPNATNQVNANTFRVTSTATLAVLNPILFSAGAGAIFGGISEGTKYYISKINSPTEFSIAQTLITVTVSATSGTGNNLITCSSTVGFVSNNPIRFVGLTFGNLVAEQIYYVSAISGDGVSFSVSNLPGQAAVNLQTGSGICYGKTCPTAFSLVTAASGTMTASSTSNKTNLTYGYSSINASFSTQLFGNVVQGTTYFVNTIDSVPRKVTISSSLANVGVTSVSLITRTGSMNLVEVGWDHVNPGTFIPTALNSSSVYFIEPRTVYQEPAFTQTAMAAPIALGSGTVWGSIAYGNGYWIAMPNGNSTAAGSSDGSSWVGIPLPTSASWKGIAYGNGYWVAISSGGTGNSTSIRSASNGAGWRTVNLPSATTWSQIAYGNGVFVTIATGTSTSAYSTTYGASWSSGSGLPTRSWTGLAFGNGRFVAVGSGTDTASFSFDGNTWNNSTLPASTTWSGVTFGNGLFVAVSSTSSATAYSQDGATWYGSSLAISADRVQYGQGVFLALTASSNVAYVSDNGASWKVKSVSTSAYSTLGFGFTPTGVGLFITFHGQSTGSTIAAGIKTKGRANITSGVITSVSMWEPGSGYTQTVTSGQSLVSFTDPNVTTLGIVQARVANGVLSSPTFYNRGNSYNTNSTAITISGNGYSDAFQTGLSIILNNLTRLPQPGDNLQITGVTQNYKVTSATVAFGTVAPNIEANIQISPAMTVANSPANNTTINIRQKYSQVRLTGHDFLNIGFGTQQESNYPNQPTETTLRQENQTVESNFGRVFFTSTDQDGNFKVGNLFGVQQATGIVTLSATQFGLTGLETLALGGIAVGGSSVVVNQFSTDSTFVANSDQIIPTQKAIRSYLTGRLSQGGANTFTGQLTAGTVLIGGPNKIASTIPNGTAGSVLLMKQTVRFSGSAASVDGNIAAVDFYFRRR